MIVVVVAAIFVVWSVAIGTVVVGCCVTVAAVVCGLVPVVVGSV